jgi:SAM-dependent methyltransferase
MPLSPRRLTEVVLELVSRPGHEKVRALMYEILVYGLGASSTDIQFERPLPEVRGRLDALLGQTVFEFKRDLRRERRTAEEELGRYLPEREHETGERFIGIATDGADFLAYEIENGKLIALPGYKVSLDNPSGLLLWLDSAVSLQPDLIPEPTVVRVELGRESLAYRRALATLAELWNDVKDRPEVQLKRQLWANFLAIVYGSRIDADALFLQHTYLTAAAKTMAMRVLAIPLPEPQDLLSGRAFHQAGISGAVESDFFDWVLQAGGGADLIARISRQVARFRLEDVGHDVLKGLYESLIDPDQRHDLGEYFTPDWLAAKICAWAVDSPLEQRVLDPACGSGSFLFHAVRRFFAAADEARLSAAEALRKCLEQVIGIDVHPVAVLVARVSYLLAIGEERLRTRPDAIALPVYLGDSLQWNTRQMFAQLDVVISVPDGPDLHFPEALASDPARFDDTIKTMLDMSDHNASDEAFRAWLTREIACSRTDVGILVTTYSHIRVLRQSGRNHIWGYVARNLSRPLWLSSVAQRADVIVGNPPWLSFRSMAPDSQRTFRDECHKRGLWSGGRVAAHHDLSAYFFARCAELYLKPHGEIAFVMPYGALNRGQFSGFRKGRFGGVEVRFVEAWAFDETVQPLFPMPSAVLFAERRAAGNLPDLIMLYTGRLQRRDASASEAKAALRHRPAPWTGKAQFTGRSAYNRCFRQGATMVPRRLCMVGRVETGRLGGNPLLPLVESRPGKLEKHPWHNLPPLRHAVEARFLRPLYLGESVAPYRVLGAALAVVPWDDAEAQMLDAASAQETGYPGLARWLEAAERLWADHGRGGELSLQQRWNYHEALRRQLPPAPVRVVYAKSGQLLSAAIVEDRRAVIDHKLYWAAFRRYSEALYVTGLLNSETIRGRISALQSRGRWGARDFDKLIFELPIPRFDSTMPSHLSLMRAALEAERIAGDVLLPPDIYFVRARQLIREVLRQSGITGEIDALVAEVVPI